MPLILGPWTSTGKDGRQDMQELRERLIGLKERIAHVMARL
jgi:hypothetical protein